MRIVPQSAVPSYSLLLALPAPQIAGLLPSRCPPPSAPEEHYKCSNAPRPTITLIIDAFSRAVLDFHVSFSSDCLSDADPSDTRPRVLQRLPTPAELDLDIETTFQRCRNFFQDVTLQDEPIAEATKWLNRI